MTTPRESLEAAAASLEAEAAPETPEAAPTEAPAAPAEASEAAPTEKPSEAAQRARDEAGRFAKAQKAAAAAKPEKPAEKAPAAPALEAKPAAGAAPKVDVAPEAAPVSGQEAIKPPQSWRAGVREHWGKLPLEVQAEISRVDKEVRQLMSDAAPAKKLAQDFQQTVAPYAPMFQADGVEPVRAVGSLLQMAATLRTAPPAQKAQLLAGLVRNFGVPIDALDAALSGQPAPQHAQQPQGIDPRAIAMQVRQEVMQDFRQQRERMLQQQSAQKLADFGATHEHFERVREEMGEALASAARHGVEMTLEQAYVRACSIHPEVSQELQAAQEKEALVAKQRQEAEMAQKANASSQKARAASTSVRPQPSGTISARPMTVREKLGEVAAQYSLK